MSKSKAQGTKWESTVVARAMGHVRLSARRIAEGGSKDIGDVMVTGIYDDRPYIVGVAWKRLVKGDGKRRQPDGEPEVVVVTLDDFLNLLDDAGRSAILECKATERLNPTRVLKKAREKAEND